MLEEFKTFSYDIATVYKERMNIGDFNEILEPKEKSVHAVRNTSSIA